MVRLTEKPFFLSDDQISWVENTVSEMTVEEKIGQIFCPIAGNPEDQALTEFVQKYQPGGMMFRPMPAKAIRQAHGVLQNESKIPLLLAANLEAGGNGICSDGTYYGRPMGVAATADEQEAYQLGFVSGREAQAVGCNWAFSPIVDIDMNFKNPITNVRTFGSDVDQVIDFSRQQMKGLHENGIATAVKALPRRRRGRARSASGEHREQPVRSGMGRKLRQSLPSHDRRGRIVRHDRAYPAAGLQQSAQSSFGGQRHSAGFLVDGIGERLAARALGLQRRSGDGCDADDRLQCRDVTQERRSRQRSMPDAT